VLIGASHTLTDAAYMTDYFIRNNVKTRVVAVPCTIDNNLGHHMLEQSIGFDTASKIYSQLIGNIMIDSASAVKYWYFMRLMGRDPSHLVISLI
jgi:6-phosphofructokinase